MTLGDRERSHWCMCYSALAYLGRSGAKCSWAPSEGMDKLLPVWCLCLVPPLPMLLVVSTSLSTFRGWVAGKKLQQWLDSATTRAFLYCLLLAPSWLLVGWNCAYSGCSLSEKRTFLKHGDKRFIQHGFALNQNGTCDVFSQKSPSKAFVQYIYCSIYVSNLMGSQMKNPILTMLLCLGVCTCGHIWTYP